MWVQSQSLSFCDWRISFGRLSSGFIYIVPCVRISFLFKAKCSSLTRLGPILLIHPFTCLLYTWAASTFATVTTTAWTWIYNYLSPASTSFGCTARVKFLEHRKIPCLFFEDSPYHFPWWEHLFVFTPEMHQVSNFSTSLPTPVLFFLLLLFYNDHSNVCWHFLVV